MPVMKLLGALGMAFLVSCGPATREARPPAPPPARIAVLGDSGGAVLLAIADLTGRVLVRATFAPMPRPLITNAGDLLPAQVHLAAGAAYYAEPTGRVHRLDAAGADMIVATFPVTTTQQELSFAVSPDGKQLMAMVLTGPSLHVPPPQDISQPFFQAGARWSEELELATAGGATRSLAKTDLGLAAQYAPPAPTTIAGWDDQGPLALLGTKLATQEPPPSTRMTGTALVHLGLDGATHEQIGGAGCRPLDELHDGTILCSTTEYPSVYEVRTAAGQLIWRQDLGGQYYGDPVLSPDGGRIATDRALFTHADRPASMARLGSIALQSQPVGWVSAGTLALTGPGGTVQVAELGDLMHPRDTRLAGEFIGTL
jgi:hypothetical protein